jgi:hypothetical protein
VKHNTVDFEIVFAGDVAPDYELPPNFKFIYTTTKVSQANLIAARACSGETLIHTGDDLQFIQKNAVDKLYAHYKRVNNYKCMIWSKFGFALTRSFVVESQKTAVGVLMSREFFNEVGGYDRRFYCNTYDVDLHYRILSRKFRGTYEVSNDASIWHRDDLTDFEAPNKKSGWFKWGGKWDVLFLEHQWLRFNGKNRIILNKSRAPFEPFEINDTLLTVSQGTGAKEWDSMHSGSALKEKAGIYSQDFVLTGEWYIEPLKPIEPPPNYGVTGMPRCIG